MSDLIDRLREEGVDPFTQPREAVEVMNEAADHIEQLEAENAELKQTLKYREDQDEAMRDLLAEIARLKDWNERMRDALNLALEDVAGWVSVARLARVPEPPQEQTDNDS